MYVFANKDCCPGRRGRHCGKSRPHKAQLYKNSPEAKAAAAGKAGAAGGGTNGGNDTAEVRKLKADLKASEKREAAA